MSYQALYRVWRPQFLKDVAGQEHITKTLQNALGQSKFSHAYLFTGPRGTGKTSAAKIMAKAINCEKAPVQEPCNECRTCIGITDGSIVDVIEIDAASNNGVDEIRDIRDKVKFAPNEVRYKVYIIDEVHMLSTGAFNALLKTLEEPPKHVVFILATTEPHKIPLTIISRCQRFDFKRITNQALVNRMQYIVSHYETTVDDDALFLLARAADGGMRDALSLLDQAISYSDGHVTVDDVLSITGAVSERFLIDVIKAISEQNVQAALQSVNGIINEGKDPQRFIEDLIFYFRDILLYQTAPSLEEALERAKVDEEFKQLASSLTTTLIYHYIDVLNHSQQEMKWASHSKIFLEVAIVKLCQQPTSTNSKENDIELDSLKSKIQQLEQTLENLKSGQGLQQVQATEEQKPKRRVTPQTSTGKVATPQIKEMLKQASKADLQRVSNSWGKVMELVRKNNIRAHAWLSDCKPVAASQTTVLLAFQNEMHRDMIDTKFRSDVEKTISEVCNQPTQLLSLLVHQWDKIKEEFVREQRGGSEEKQEDPMVDEAIKLVGHDLIEIIE
ncbi:DNA polymerase III subunit gamma/tau [Alkalihalobacterium bogoriense]|uniref:DNA polymerase III subunit gamma/tau n=1 Tax=Alkalihalobacterium bogoriense TaxID=246272 RepID=UPI0004796DF8|nr:DNA polymerase III subunit gamma/tau [Alkalihalobacterium bogoriense]